MVYLRLIYNYRILLIDLGNMSGLSMEPALAHSSRSAIENTKRPKKSSITFKQLSISTRAFLHSSGSPKQISHPPRRKHMI